MFHISEPRALSFPGIKGQVKQHNNQGAVCILPAERTTLQLTLNRFRTQLQICLLEANYICAAKLRRALEQWTGEKLKTSQIDPVAACFIIIIYKMQNNQNHQLSKCEFHSFSLRALHKQRKPSLNASLSMCRAKQTKNKKSRDYCLNYEGPILNRDRSHATPAFILPNQKIEYVQSARQILREHEKRVKQSEADIEELYVPKPRSKNMYCNVCRENYKEYLDHISSQSHRNNVRNSEFNGHILELQQKFKKQINTDLTISSTDSASREESEVSVQIIGISGRKKIKTESEQQFNSFCPFYNPNFNYAPFPANYHPFSFNQMQMYNSFNEMLNSQSLLGRQYLPAGFAPMNSFMQQNRMPFPQYFMAYQPGYPINVFQQQV